MNSAKAQRPRFRIGDWVTFQYGPRTARGPSSPPSVGRAHFQSPSPPYRPCSSKRLIKLSAADMTSLHRHAWGIFTHRTP